MTTPNRLKSPEEVKADLITTVAPARVQALRVVSMLGAILAVFGSVNFTGIAAFLPPDIAAWALTLGIGLMGAKQGLLVIGDLLDNGKRDNSFMLPSFFVLLAALGVACGSLTSCGTIPITVTPDGCVTTPYTHEGQAYTVGACFDAEGKPERYVTTWRNPEGVLIRATLYAGTKRYAVHYASKDGTWLEWDSKAGLLLGNVPPNLENAPL